MRIFIAGATGVLGRRVAKLLLKDGHKVIALSRSLDNDIFLTSIGVTYRRGDLFDKKQMINITNDCDAILNLATSIPAKSKTNIKDWHVNDKIRTVGTSNLVNAAIINSCDFFLQQSVVFLYGKSDGLINENHPVSHNISPILNSAIEMEKIIESKFISDNLPATVLRFGSFYSFDSYHTKKIFDMARNGFTPIIGKGNFYINTISVDDAANAILSAIRKKDLCSQKFFNVCDDNPILHKELQKYISYELSTKKPIHLPICIANLALGKHMVDVLLNSSECRNILFKKITGWKPSYDSVLESYKNEILKWKAFST